MILIYNSFKAFVSCCKNAFVLSLSKLVFYIYNCVWWPEERENQARLFENKQKTYLTFSVSQKIYMNSLHQIYQLPVWGLGVLRRHLRDSQKL